MQSPVQPFSASPLSPGRVVTPRRAALALLGGLLAGCGTPRDLIAPVADGFDVERDIAYGAGPRRLLDLYRPRGDAGGAPRPLVVYYFGGIWTNGTKDDPSSFALPRALAARGAVVVAADYRLYPETGYPGFLEDGAQAAAWAQRHAAAVGADPRLVFLAGHSSGAHMAMLLGVDPRFLAAAGFGPQQPAGLIGISGVYERDVFELPIVRPVFRGVADLAEVLPASYLRPDVPPVLLLTGGWDWMVQPRNSRRLAEAVRAAGGSAEARVYGGTGHFDILTTLLLAPSLSPVADDIAAFVRARAAALMQG